MPRSGGASPASGAGPSAFSFSIVSSLATCVNSMSGSHTSSGSYTCSEEHSTVVSMDRSMSRSSVLGRLNCVSSFSSSMPCTLLERTLGASATTRVRSSLPSSSSSGMSMISAACSRSSYLERARCFSSSTATCCSCLRRDKPVNFLPVISASGSMSMGGRLSLGPSNPPSKPPRRGGGGTGWSGESPPPPPLTLAPAPATGDCCAPDSEPKAVCMVPAEGGSRLPLPNPLSPG
mmetsp:Transcript_6641/g.16498  ORF Transcript_6641/g.16498 Transcript_6641/m.16498 type:complete len:234 (+) Transcript_6641:797-1498(+)